LSNIQNITHFYVDMHTFVKTGRSAAQLLRIFDFQNGSRPPSCIFIFSEYLSKLHICAYFYVHLQNLVQIGRSPAVLLHTFNFQNGGRSPSWIWYDVISDHPQLVFDGPNILLKLHVDRFLYFARYHDFYIWSFWLEIAYSRPFLEFLGDITPNEFWYCRNPKRTVLERKHVVRTMNRGNLSKGSIWARALEKIQYNLITMKKSQNRNISLIWGDALAEQIEMKICTGVELRDIIMNVKFKQKKNQWCWCHWGSKFTISHWLCTWALNTVQRYRAACDQWPPAVGYCVCCVSRSQAMGIASLTGRIGNLIAPFSSLMVRILLCGPPP